MCINEAVQPSLDGVCTVALKINDGFMQMCQQQSGCDTFIFHLVSLSFFRSSTLYLSFRKGVGEKRHLTIFFNSKTTLKIFVKYTTWAGFSKGHKRDNLYFTLPQQNSTLFQMSIFVQKIRSTSIESKSKNLTWKNSEKFEC